MADLQVRVFGKLRLKKGSAVVDTFPTRRVEELFGYLLLHKEERQPREKLVATLWPDVALQNGRASLSTTLWRLRSVFEQIGAPPDTFFQATRDWICFQPVEPVDIDLSFFEHNLAEAQRETDLNKRESALRAALAKYKGDLYEGVYADWCLLERERLGRRYLRALGQLIACLIQREQYDEAIALGQDIIQQDPLREEVHRAIMYCYWKLGRRARAVNQFQLCARLLQNELQVMPMPETLNLYRLIIEDRISDLWASGTQSKLQRQQVHDAYESFISAAESLNNLLDAAENAQKTVPVPSAEENPEPVIGI